MAELYTRKPNTNCKICYKLIYRRPSQIQLNNGNVFCSNSCYGKSCRDERPCVICGKMVLSSLHRKTCSRTCSNKNRAGIRYGIKRPNDKVKAQDIIKKRLIELRGMRCEQCGYNKYEILHIHHIDRDRSNNKFNNLELICPNCHYEKHFKENSLENKTKI